MQYIFSDEKLGEVIEQLVQKEKIDLSVEANVYIGKDTRWVLCFF